MDWKTNVNYLETGLVDNFVPLLILLEVVRVCYSCSVFSLLIDCHYVDVVHMHSWAQHEEREQFDHVWYELEVDNFWPILLPHQLYKHLDCVLFKHNVVRLAPQQVNEVIRVFSLKDPVKVKGLNCDSSKVVLLVWVEIQRVLILIHCVIACDLAHAVLEHV